MGIPATRFDTRSAPQNVTYTLKKNPRRVTGIGLLIYSLFAPPVKARWGRLDIPIQAGVSDRARLLGGFRNDAIEEFILLDDIGDGTDFSVDRNYATFPQRPTIRNDEVGVGLYTVRLPIGAGP